MRLSKRSRKFHDPWGNKFSNRVGTIVRFQYHIGLGDLGSRKGSVNIASRVFDTVGSQEHNKDRFVRGPYSIEKLRT